VVKACQQEVKRQAIATRFVGMFAAGICVACRPRISLHRTHRFSPGHQFLVAYRIVLKSIRSIRTDILNNRRWPRPDLMLIGRGSLREEAM